MGESTDKLVLGLGVTEIVFGLLYLICTIVYNVEIGAPSALTFVGCIPVRNYGFIFTNFSWHSLYFCLDFFD